LDEYRNPSTATVKVAGEDDDFQRADSVMNYYEGGHGHDHGHDHKDDGHGHDHGHHHGEDEGNDDEKYAKAMGQLKCVLAVGIFFVCA